MAESAELEDIMESSELESETISAAQDVEMTKHKARKKSTEKEVTPDLQEKEVAVEKEIKSIMDDTWEELIRRSPHQDKLKAAILINPAAVQKLLRGDHMAEQAHNQEMLKIYQSLSTDLEQLGDKIRREYEIDEFLNDMFELEMAEDEANLGIIHELQHQILPSDRRGKRSYGGKRGKSRRQAGLGLSILESSTSQPFSVTPPSSSPTHSFTGELHGQHT